MEGVRGVVLCGGPGKRLRPITYYFQKTMVPIGRRQKPVLEYIVRLLRHHGITKLTLLVDYKAEQIINYFDDGSRFGVDITYVYDEPGMKGTAGSVLNAYRKGAVGADETLLIYYGDILSNIDLGGLIGYHREKNALITVALALSFIIRVGVAQLEDDGRIVRFKEKPKLDKPVSIGILALEGRALRDLEGLMEGRNELDIMGDVVPYLARAGGAYGYITDAYWYDIGSIEAYEKLDAEAVDRYFSHLF